MLPLTQFEKGLMHNALPDETQKNIQEKLQHLVNVAFQKGIEEAVKEARALGDPYLLDAFHDVLVDKLYDELITQHKLDPQA